ARTLQGIAGPPFGKAPLWVPAPPMSLPGVSPMSIPQTLARPRALIYNPFGVDKSDLPLVPDGAQQRRLQHERPRRDGVQAEERQQGPGGDGFDAADPAARPG